MPQNKSDRNNPRRGLSPTRFVHLLCVTALRALMRSPRGVIVLTLVWLLGCAYAMTHLRAITTINELLDETNSEYARMRDAKNDFEKPDFLLLTFYRADLQPLRSEDLCVIHKWSVDYYKTTAYAEAFRSPFFLRQPLYDKGRLLYPKIVGDPCETESFPGLAPLTSSLFAPLLMSPDQTNISFQFEFKFPENASRYHAAAIEDLEARVASISSARTPILHHVSGSVPTRSFYRKALLGDQRLNLAVIIIMMLLMRFFFGTWRGGFLLVGSLVFTGLSLYGCMAVFQQPIDLLANSLFVLVSVAALEDFMMVSHVRLTTEKSWMACFSSLVTPSFFTSLTTMIGFGSLVVSNVAAIRRFGLWAAFGAFLEWVCVFFLIPIVLSQVPKLREWTSTRRAHCADVIQRLTLWQPTKGSVYVALLILAGSLWVLPKIRIEDSPEVIFPPHHPITEGIRFLKEHRGWGGTFSLIFTEDETNSALTQRNKMVLRKLREIPEVAAIVDGYQYQDSLKTFGPPDIQSLLQREFRSSPASGSFFSTKGHGRALIFVKAIDTKTLKHIRSEIAVLCPDKECFATGDLISYSIFTDEIIGTFVESLWLSIGLVTLILALLMRGMPWDTKFAVLVSSLWGVGVSLGVFYFADLEMNFCTSIFATILVGLSGDNAIQYIFAGRRDQIASGLNSCGGASVRTAVTMALSMLCLLGSSFWQPRQLGGVFAGGVLLLLVGDLWLLRGLQPLLKRR